MSSSHSYQRTEGARTLSEHSPTSWRKPSPQSVIVPSTPSTPQQLSPEVTLLQSKQRHLKSRLTTLLNQQLQEGFGQYPMSRSVLSLPNSLELMIFGLREELERVGELLLLLQQENVPPSSR
ncbi:hypothetical protein IAD21_01636 [Abditibacteriota bacterium]|nr:hypothetical protein IAD21_01636 [Abditibacteriota bacterium]